MQYLDALGNPMIIGETYGFCQSVNGCTDIKLGELTHFTKTGRASLKVFRSSHCLYNSKLKTELVESRASIYPFKLFPVNKTNLPKIKENEQ